MAPATTTATATTTNVQVALRIRPITPQDTVSIPTRFQRIVIHGTSETSVSVDAVASVPQGAPSAPAVAPASTSNKKQAFTFDQVHNAESTQFSIYTSTAKPLIDRFIEGFNCTILAYGQTSSGKTHTMTGMDLDGDPSDSNNGMGIIPRSIAEVFERISRLKSARRDAWKATVKGSFIEIYNEDLIDLLSSDDPNTRRDVHIREDKEGNILWEGLREVPVRTVSDVMDLIRKGTAIRRTNETQMNAQSSRSHAVFSLTLTQKRYTGSSPPPRSSSPLPPQASPSRLARPGSMYTSSASSNRTGSPTFGRPPTPSFHSAMNRAPQYLRPHSSLGHSEDNRLTGSSTAPGEWTTITSKFHFVDLAGSERLKRTAAAGERIKEGISINSGLLALGNVISALGDVSKSRITTHIPYRDSKLTRLLQDSLGGNAHTLMIACVSPVEWNVGETVNTLKYANRARNIRNRARIDEKEEGWEDVEWLQNNVVKLRKELKALRSGAEIPPSESEDLGSTDKLSNSAKQVREQLAELQTQYVELRQRFTDRTEELTRLRREAGENIRRSGGSLGGVGRYEEIVGPVIEEYEKTISSMEAELSLNRAALRHTNDILTEKEEEISGELERHAVAEAYVEELRGRVAKLSERETSTEAYIQDLEEKIKGFSTNSLTTSESLSALQKDLTKYKDLESTNATYIAELESRLTKSEENVLTLQRAVAEGENMAEQRARDVQALEQKLLLMTSDEQGWRTELEQREEKVKALEAQMKEWESVKDEAARQRERLGGLVSGVEDARKGLDSSSRPSSSLGRTRPSSPISSNVDSATVLQLQALQETHAATLLDLETVTTKYKDALREIADLAAQLEEAKLDSSVHSTPLTISVREASGPPLTNRRKPSINRGDPNEITSTASPTISPSGRRVFFRQAVSTDSISSMARSHSQSLSLSQEFASGRSQQRLIPTPGLRHQRSESLLSGLRPNGSLQNTTSAPHTTRDRSVESLEQEIMRLQEVIRERESEIAVLEKTSHGALNGDDAESDSIPKPTLVSQTLEDELSELRDSLAHDLANGEHRNSITDKRSSIGRFDELMRSMAQKESQHQEVVDSLNQQLQQIRRQHDELTTLSRDQAHNMSNELESLRRVHEQAVQDLQGLQARDAQLTASVADSTKRHNKEMELLTEEHSKQMALKVEQIQRLAQQLEKASSSTELGELHQALAKAQAELVKVQGDRESLKNQVQSHQDALAASLKEKDEVLCLKTEHESAISRLKEEHEEQVRQAKSDSAEALRRSDEEYYLAVSKLCGQHEETIKIREEKAQQDLERLRSELEAQARQADFARQGALADTQSAQAEAISKLQEEHASALSRVRDELSSDMERLAADHMKALEFEKSRHAEQVTKLKSQHAATIYLKEQLQGKVDQLQNDLDTQDKQHRKQLLSLQEEKSEALRLLQLRVQELEDETQCLIREHTSALEAVSKDNDATKEHLIQSHALEVSQVRLEHQNVTSELEASQLVKEEEHRLALRQFQNQHEQLIAAEKERHQTTVLSSEELHVQEKIIWEKDRDLLSTEIESLTLALNDSTSRESQLHEEKTSLIHARSELQAAHQATLETSTSVSAQHESVLSELEELRRQHAESTQALKSSEQKNLELLASTEAAEKVFAEITSLKGQLQKASEQAEQMSREKVLSENTIRDLQVQLANARNRISASLSQDNTPHRPTMERALSHPRPNGIPPAKLPPLSPPPSIPPPPLPMAAAVSHSEAGHASLSSVSSRGRQSTGSQETHETIPTSIASVNGISEETISADAGQAQNQLIDEQEAMIKTLNKQLAHCETDLQAHMDLVSTLESSLNDSERNLRKSRQQSNELSRERDSLTRQLEATRNEVREIQRELASARQAVIEQTQSLESRLDEERRAKDRARAQLDARMEELQKRKSKFACM